MAKKVMQYELKQITKQSVFLPVGAQILNADIRSGSGPTIWALIDHDQTTLEDRDILIMETNVAVDLSPDQFKRMRHLGTYHENSFGKSFSVFEERAVPVISPYAKVTLEPGPLKNAEPWRDKDPI